MPSSTIDCPRCKLELRKTTIREKNQSIEVDQCDHCQGIWFDEQELSQLDKIVEPVLWEQRSLPLEDDQLKALQCPACKEFVRMEKHEHPRDEKVIIDVCISCKGIWLDKGELRAIQQQGLFSLLFGI